MNALGIIFSNIHDNNVPELTAHRTMAAIPFCGRYRLIDFPLSSMVNSGVTHVGVVTKSNYRSLMDHVGSGKEWDLARRNGGFVLLPPYGENNNSLYSTRLEALKNILGFIMRCNEEYVVMTDSNSVYAIDYSKMMEYHESKMADITMLYVNKDCKQIEGSDHVIFKTDSDGRVVEMLLDPKMSGKVKLYGDVLIIKRSLLISFVSDAISRGKSHFLADILMKNIKRYKIMGYEHAGYFEEISSLKRYYEITLDLIKPETYQRLFGESQIYTKIKDSAPTVYGANAIVKNSLIADGCVIEGEVYNSVLSRGVKVGRGTVIRDSVIMKNTITGENVVLNSIIADKSVVVRDKMVLSGAKTHPFYIPKESII